MISRANFRAEEGALSTPKGALNERSVDGRKKVRWSVAPSDRYSIGSSQHKGGTRMNSFVNGLQSHSTSPDPEDRPGDKPARRDATAGRGLLDRILNTPSLEHVVPRLRPDLLHPVIQTCGLEDCGEIVALATPEQLARIFD